jgi:hypothetical protein
MAVVSLFSEDGSLLPGGPVAFFGSPLVALGGLLSLPR